MGHNISQLKAQYFPTDRRLCNYFAMLHFPIEHKNEDLYRVYKSFNSSCEEVKNAIKEIEEYEEYMKTNVYKFKKDWHKIPNYSTYKFQKDIIENNEKDIEKFSLDVEKMKALCNINAYGQNVSVCDFFAGEGEWLINSKRYEPNNFYSKIRTLGVELVKERAKKLEENKVNYYYNCAYEDFSISEESISLLLFNPPYSTINGERLTKLYLQDVINKKYLVPVTSFVDFVIREDDFNDCLDLLLDHFVIVEETMFKAPCDEYNKFKQVVFTAKYRSYEKPFLDTKYAIKDRQDTKEKLLQKINNLEEINLMKISNETIEDCRKIIPINFDEIMKSIKLKDNNKNKISENNDLVWNWFKDLTQINTSTIGNLTIPKKLKQGEIINVISSGILNRKIDNHVVVGGTQQITETTTSIKIDGKGKEHEQIEVKKVNVPYFNILLPTGEIKKLFNKIEIESEE